MASCTDSAETACLTPEASYGPWSLLLVRYVVSCPKHCPAAQPTPAQRMPAKTSFDAGRAKHMDLLRRVQAGMKLRPVQLCFKRLVDKTYVKVYKK